MQKHVKLFAERKGLPLEVWKAGPNTYYDFALRETYFDRIISVRCFSENGRGLFEVNAGVSRQTGGSAVRRYRGFFIARGRTPEDFIRLSGWLDMAFSCITITKKEDLADVIPEDGCEYMRVHTLMPIFDTSEVETELQPEALA